MFCFLFLVFIGDLIIVFIVFGSSVWIGVGSSVGIGVARTVGILDNRTRRLGVRRGGGAAGSDLARPPAEGARAAARVEDLCARLNGPAGPALSREPGRQTPHCSWM